METIIAEKAKAQHALKHTEQYKKNITEENSSPLSEVNTDTTRKEHAKLANVSHDAIASRLRSILSGKDTPGKRR